MKTFILWKAGRLLNVISLILLVILGAGSYHTSLYADEEHSVQEIIAAIGAPLSAEEINGARRTDEQLLSTGNFLGSRGYLVTDSRMTTIPTRITQNLLNAMGENPNGWIVRVVDTNPPQVNAFVTGGKYIYIFKALIDKAGGEDELSFIIAHELGHSFLHHIKRRGEAQTQSLSNLADMIAIIIKGKDGLSQTKPFTDAIRADYSRTDENEADTFGTILAKKAGYNPLRGIDFFTRQVKAQMENLRLQLGRLQREEAGVNAAAAQCNQYVEASNRYRTRQAYNNMQQVCARYENQRIAYNNRAEAYNRDVTYNPFAVLYMGHPPDDERIALIATLVDYLEGKRDLNSLNTRFSQSYKVVQALQQLNSPLIGGSHNTQTDTTQDQLFKSAVAYLNTGNYQRAVDEFTKAIELNPKVPTNYNNRGVAHNKLSNHSQALDDYDTAIRLKPDYAIAYFNRGNVYGKIGNNTHAIEDYKTAARLGHQNAQNYLKSNGIEW